MLPTHDALTTEVKERNSAMNWLLENFPNSFDLRNRRPLKDKIIDDVIAKGLPSQPSIKALQNAFTYYSEWGSYLNALQEGATCFDLDGRPCGQVSKQTMLQAQALLQAASNKQS